MPGSNGSPQIDNVAASQCYSVSTTKQLHYLSERKKLILKHPDPDKSPKSGIVEASLLPKL